MSRLTSRAAVLTLSRTSNFVIHLLNPLLLVRILDVSAFGRYQEFAVYTIVLTSVSALNIDSSLTYFIPRYPGREREWVSQTSAMILITSGFCALTLLAGRSLLLELFSYDFVLPLAAYVFCFVNLNWLEYYWIAKRRPRPVLYYSAARLAVRISVVLVVAYATRDLSKILWSMVAVEALRALTVLAYLIRKGMLTGNFRLDAIREQLSFAAPIGASQIVLNFGHNIGKIFIGNTLGPVALAYYAVGGYIQPVVRAIRSGIEDAVYPELVRAHSESRGPLRLWQRVNVLNCLVFFPSFVLLVFYSRELVTVLFTKSYLPAVPIFVVYALFVVRRCFNADVLLRSAGQTGFVFWGAIGALCVNISLILLLYRPLGILGPAIAFIVAEFALEAYYSIRVRRKLKVSISDLADWQGVGRVAAGCVVSLPILIVFKFVPGPELINSTIASLLYLPVVAYCAHRLGVPDVARVVGMILSRIPDRTRE